MGSILSQAIDNYLHRSKMEGTGVASEEVKRIMRYHGPGYRYRVRDGMGLEWYRNGKWQKVPPIPEDE